MNAQSLPHSVPFGGRYWLTRRIAVGGMAEIFLARQEDGGAGFDKTVVIKRLRPELCADPRVTAMFRDEARIGALINHPNTVHIYDVGVHEGTPFIAMEYIRGEELSDLCRRGLGLGAFLPRILAVELIRQAALSMGHFHALRDADGLQLDIVHCDISPTNLLVTEEGFLKVIDFGIAQYRGQDYRDEAAVPGKLSYMSPEQARRETLDHRSDIYSLGIVLYELTLGRRLFRGPANEVAARLISGEVKPPTFVSQDYPGALESIVMRALESRSSERYETAFDLADELATFLAEEAGSLARSGPLAVARYLDQLRVADGHERRPELVSESEALAGDDDLDFDRGALGQLGSGAITVAAAEWEDLEEDEQAVADALGIDVQLVRTQTRAADDNEFSVDVSFEDGAENNGGAPAGEFRAPAPFEPRAGPAPAPGPHAASATGAPYSPTAPTAPAAPTIRPLDPPSPIGSILVGIAIGGAVTFLILQFLL